MAQRYHRNHFVTPLEVLNGAPENNGFQEKSPFPGQNMFRWTMLNFMSIYLDVIFSDVWLALFRKSSRNGNRKISLSACFMWSARTWRSWGKKSAGPPCAEGNISEFNWLVASSSFSPSVFEMNSFPKQGKSDAFGWKNIHRDLKLGWFLKHPKKNSWQNSSVLWMFYDQNNDCEDIHRKLQASKILSVQSG